MSVEEKEQFSPESSKCPQKAHANVDANNLIETEKGEEEE
jgi:hypothetical protein